MTTPSAAADWEVREGDCIEVMAAMPAASVDAVVCDPPYGLGFMGKEWDSTFAPADVPMRRNAAQDAVNAGAARQGGRQRAGQDYQRRMARDSREFQAWCEAWATECLRVLKPGGHLLAFGGTRTYHRLAAGIEDAGFEIRDTLAWMYGQGFPKSLDVSKALDRHVGAQREPTGRDGRTAASSWLGTQDGDTSTWGRGEWDRTDRPATPAAEQWQGWGTALKPSHEPVVVARKPLGGTVARNVLAHGTGALNIDGTRIDTDGERIGGGAAGSSGFVDGYERGDGFVESGKGRWPANVLLDEQVAAVLDDQTGTLTSGKMLAGTTPKGERNTYGQDAAGGYATTTDTPGDSGGASRFFYVAKAGTAERNAGLDGFDPRNIHPTVKPIDVMRWLVRLVTPPGGLVLDPFTGSGTTGCASVLEGFRFLGIEREAEYAAIAKARIEWWARRPGVSTPAALAAIGTEDAAKATGQIDLFVNFDV